jgi:hypothetical protein
VFGGLNRALAAAVVAGAAVIAVLVGPSAAFACSGGTSAVAVYTECQTTGGGGKHPTHTSTKPKSSASSAPQHLSSNTQKALKGAGHDKKALTRLVRSYGPPRQLQTVHASSTPTPSAVGSAFDLGSGPTALLIVLGGTAILLLGGSGVRVWRTRQR